MYPLYVGVNTLIQVYSLYCICRKQVGHCHDKIDRVSYYYHEWSLFSWQVTNYYSISKPQNFINYFVLAKQWHFFPHPPLPPPPLEKKVSVHASVCTSGTWLTYHSRSKKEAMGKWPCIKKMPICCSCL